VVGYREKRAAEYKRIADGFNDLLEEMRYCLRGRLASLVSEGLGNPEVRADFGGYVSTDEEQDMIHLMESARHRANRLKTPIIGLFATGRDLFSGNNLEKQLAYYQGRIEQVKSYIRVQEKLLSERPVAATK
jgi:hypothetical protein